MAFKYSRGGKIPGVSGRVVPGTARLPAPGSYNGFNRTRVPYIAKESGGSSVFREYHRQQIRNVKGQFGGGTGFAWQGLRELDEAVYDFGDGILRDTEKAIKDLAIEMERWMKDNAKWVDDTGDARQGLQAAVVREGPSSWSIYVGHGKDIYYGVWLEVRFGGKFAILTPTLIHFAPQLASKIASRT